GGSAGGRGGSPYGTVLTLEGGSGGGGGAGDDDGGLPDDAGGGGGGGGGVVSLDALRRIVVTGRIHARGGDGGEELCDGGSGGGGSGGWVLLLAGRALPDISMGVVDVAGGAGGGSLVIGSRGGDGAEGRFDIGMTPRCSDGHQNRDETDVDCGGTLCGACAGGLMCLENRDCTSGTCTANVCAP
ncbi:MAG: hypothetical protein R3B82_29770, partial [Sandaracinaceae bacterium]